MQELRELPISACCLTGALLLLPAAGCVRGEGLLGELTDTDTGTGTGTDTSADSGSGDLEPACTEDCDPDFAVSYLRGANFMGQSLYRLSTTTCEGPRCPETVTPLNNQGDVIEDCLDTEAAQTSPVGPEEHCRMIPGWLATRLDVSFTTPVERRSFEEIRPQLEDQFPQEPDRLVPYVWYPEVVAMHGPGTAVRGDYTLVPVTGPGTLASAVNESCAERLTALGVPWTLDELESLCVGTWDDDGVLRPLRMNPAMTFVPKDGSLSTREASCDTPESGPDTCCSACDQLLGPRVARYGVDVGGARRNANEGTAIACNTAGDALIECRDLVLDVEREPGISYDYAWDGGSEVWPLPRSDKLRETHPEDRPAGLELGSPTCIDASDCAESQDCIGTNATGEACHTGADCVARTCRAEWFGSCEINEGGAAFCVDRRFSARAAGACLAATTDFAHGVAGDRLSACDTNGDGETSAAECCDAALGGAAGCDPFYQPNLVDVPRFDRDATLPPEAACVCEEGQPAACAEVVDAWCEAPLGSESDPGPASTPGDYAVPAVTRQGGVRWDEDFERLTVYLATRGLVPRAETERCAEFEGIISVRNPADGWLAHDSSSLRDVELFEDHDLALCSGSTYRLVFAESGAGHHIRSEGGGNLEGRAEYVIETPQFRVEPGSLGAFSGTSIESCQELELRLSNRYDGSLSNLRKMELREGALDGPRVAGGQDCDPQAGPSEIAAGAIPCVTIDGVTDFSNLYFFIDEAIHGPVLKPGTTYFAVLPGLADISEMSDPEAYAAAFHDVCGMPLIVGDTPEELALSELSFTVDGACR